MSVTALPISILWKVRISTRRKIGLLAVFSATVITVSFSIFRTVRTVIVNSQSVMDETWIFLWSALEVYIGRSGTNPRILHVLTSSVSPRCDVSWLFSQPLSSSGCRRIPPSATCTGSCASTRAAVLDLGSLYFSFSRPHHLYAHCEILYTA